MALTPGTRLGPYEIDSSLGTGGQGEVDKARDTRLNRTVAIKVLPPGRPIRATAPWPSLSSGILSNRSPAKDSFYLADALHLVPLHRGGDWQFSGKRLGILADARQRAVVETVSVLNHDSLQSPMFFGDFVLVHCDTRQRFQANWRQGPGYHASSGPLP